MLNTAIKFRRCNRCGLENDEEAFFRRDTSESRRSASTLAEQQYRAVCVGCEQTERDEIKEADRWLAKARSTISHHCDKFNDRCGTDLTPREFASRFGWVAERIAHDMEHAYGNGCTYCHRLYRSMKNGPSDITVDIVNRDEEPYYVTNTKLCCQTCNKEKGKTPPHLWARKLLAWARWEAHQKLLKIDQTVGLPIFEFLKAMVTGGRS
jgi:hypothetical protein